MTSSNTCKETYKKNSKCIKLVQMARKLSTKEIKMKDKGNDNNSRTPSKTKINAESMESSTSPKYLLSLLKTPGTIIFRAIGNNGIIQNVDHQLTNPLRLSYKLKTLQFGLGNNFFDFPIAHRSKVVEEYIKDLEGNLATREFVQDFTQKD